MTTVARFPQALCCSDLERLPTYQPVHDEQPSQLPPQVRSSQPAGGFGSLRGGKRRGARVTARLKPQVWARFCPLQAGHDALGRLGTPDALGRSLAASAHRPHAALRSVAARISNSVAARISNSRIAAVELRTYK